MQFNTIGFIGCGNMGGALAQALPKAGQDIFLANRTQSKADALAAKIGATVTDNQTIAKTCDLIFLGVKPQMMPGVLARLACPWPPSNSWPEGPIPSSASCPTRRCLWVRA